MIVKYALFSLVAFAATPAVAQQPARAALAAEAAEGADVVGDLIEKARDDAQAAPDPRVGLTVRAVTGAPVGQVAAVTNEGVVLRLQVKDRATLKLIAREHLEVKGDAAITDLTLSELQRLPDVAQAAE